MLCVPGPGEVKWVDEAQGCGSGGTTGREVTKEVAAELGVLVDATKEHLLVLVLEGEVQRLRWEITDDVGEVASPEAEETLFSWDADEAIYHTCGTIKKVLSFFSQCVPSVNVNFPNQSNCRI